MKVSTGRLALAGAALGWALAATSDPAAAQRAAPRPAPAPPPGWIGFWYEVGVGPDHRPVVVVDRVEPGSPAERAGLGGGDTLLAVDGATFSPAAFRALGQGLRAGDEVRLTIRRDGRRRDVDVVATSRPRGLATTLELVTDSTHRTLLASVDSVRTHLRLVRPSPTPPRTPDGPRPQAPRATPFQVFVWSAADSVVERFEPGEPAASASFRPLTPYMAGRDRAAGARLTPLNEGLAPYFGVGRGLLVVDVAAGTPSDEAGLRPGDVILSVAGTPVAGMDDLRSALARAPSRPVALGILRKGRRFETRLP